jgi:4-amino-4-deoxy-L-arabinose transferase-like glycosyltransferase
VNILRASVFAVVAFACFFQLGAMPLRETDEGFAANRAASFARHGTWLLSYDDVGDDEPQFKKPPLLYWCVAGLYEIAGRNVWAVRLPTATLSFVLCVLLYLITRRHLGEAAALCAAVLPVTVPFFFWHIRTAMLDLPLLALALGATYLFAYSDRWGRTVAGGLVAGAAIMVKAAAGGFAVLTPLVFAFVMQRFDKRLLARAVVFLVLALVPIGAYVMALSDEMRQRCLESFFVHETAGRMREHGPVRFWKGVGLPLYLNLLWYLPAAAMGLVLLLAQVRRPGRASWLALALLVSVPVYAVAIHETVAYPRYLLPVYPFILTLAAWFCLQGSSSRWASSVLVLFAGASILWMPKPLAYVPAVFAAIAWVAAWLPAVRWRDGARLAAGLLLLGSIAWSTRASELSRLILYRDDRWYRPEVEPLAARARTVIPPGEKIIVGPGFKLHNVLFHSDRAVEPVEDWLRAYAPGSVRYGLFAGGTGHGLPHIATTVLAATNDWELLELRTDPEPGIAGFVAILDGDRDATARAFDALGILHEEHPTGLLLSHMPGWTGLVEVSKVDDVLIVPGEFRLLELPAAVRLAGVDLVPARRKALLADLAVEVPDAAGGWRTVRSWTAPPAAGWDLEAGRLVKRSGPTLRARWEPVMARTVRIVNRGGTEIRLAGVALWALPDDARGHAVGDGEGRDLAPDHGAASDDRAPADP